ncbi:CAP domain-containing protein [Saccharothrix isguenensis]
MRFLVAVVTAASVALATTGGCVVVSQDGSTGPPPQSPPADRADAPPAQRMARDIFDRVNAERAERGLEPVSWNEDLAGVARTWSEEMSRTGRFEHQDTGGLLRGDRLPGFVAVGENIFRATGPVPAGTIHAGWMRSDGHRANVVNPGWNRLGVGVFCADDGSVWATEEFGRTSDADRPPVAEETPPVEPIARPEATGPQCR